MDYAIMERGREIGRLYARQEGLYTVFEARLPRRAGLTRLYLCGGGECRLLGVMEPDEKGLRLFRRLSRRALPARIEYAATAPESDAPPKKTPPGGEAGWRDAGGGALYHAGKRLLAVPAALRRARGGVRTLEINGKEYIVFRW